MWRYLLTNALVPAVAAAAVFTIPGPKSASPVFDGFVSYSIEFAFWPDFAGNLSAPNHFSDNLLKNLGDLQGVRPYIRVGGNTQDYALYNAALPYAVNGTYDVRKSPDYPTTLHIGPSYFESYRTFNNTKFTHGFNLGLGGNRTDGWETLIATVPLACKAIGKDRLDWWEYGNEPDLFSTSAQGPVRPSSWNENQYVMQWLNGTRQIKEQLQKHCPDMLGSDVYGYMAPSNAGTGNRLKAPLQWTAGLNTDKNVKIFSTHNYISGAGSPGVTLQGTLMNHDRTMQSANAHVSEYAKIKASDANVPPMILGEHNSLYNQGKPGLSNSFGAALWGIDFNLYAASVGIKRSHMHMGTDYRYASWQPIRTPKTPRGTKAPYYGNIAVAAFLGPSPVSVAHVPLNMERAAAYAAYTDNQLARLIVINLQAYNSTIGGTGETINPGAPPRPSFKYAFQVPQGLQGPVGVQRLFANGSDAITGITWDGWSYNYELDEGRPVRMRNVTIGERVDVKDGQVEVELAASQAAVLHFRHS